jgi:hypothetical protein
MKKEITAYIAGFIDGDGSIRIQLQPRKNSFRVRAIISLAQKWGKEKELTWIRNQFKIGYLYQRNDRMTELRIEGHKAVEKILKELKPYFLFKRKQVELVLKILEKIKVGKVTLLKVAELTDKISKLNYVTVEKKYTAKYIREHTLSNTPVTTDSSPDVKSG